MKKIVIIILMFLSSGYIYSLDYMNLYLNKYNLTVTNYIIEKDSKTWLKIDQNVYKFETTVKTYTQTEENNLSMSFADNINRPDVFKLNNTLIVDDKLSVNMKDNEIKNISIVDIMGITHDIKIYSNNIIDTSSLISGCYLLLITSTDNKMYVSKFIKY